MGNSTKRRNRLNLSSHPCLLLFLAWASLVILGCSERKIENAPPEEVSQQEQGTQSVRPGGQHPSGRADYVLGSVVTGILVLFAALLGHLINHWLQDARQRRTDRYSTYGTLSGLRFSFPQLVLSVLNANVCHHRYAALRDLGGATAASQGEEASRWGLEAFRLIPIMTNVRQSVNETLANVRLQFEVTPEMGAAIKTLVHAGFPCVEPRKASLQTDAKIKAWSKQKGTELDAWVQMKLRKPLEVILQFLEAELGLNESPESGQGKEDT